MNSALHILKECFLFFESQNITTTKKAYYKLCESFICINYGSLSLYQQLHPPIAHQEIKETHEPYLKLLAIGHSCLNLPSKLQKQLSELQKINTHATQQEPIFYYENPRGKLVCLFENNLRELYYYDQINNYAIAYFPNSTNANHLPSGSLASPFRSIFSWICDANHDTILHAAAVGSTEGATLLLGASGSGKSTIALSCLNAGLGFAGDDSILVNTKGIPSINSLYQSAKISREDLIFFKKANFIVRENVPTTRNKLHLLNSSSQSDFILKQAPIRAIVIPRVKMTLPSGLREISKMQALVETAAPCLTHIPNNRQKALNNLKQILLSAPCYSLNIADRSIIVPSIKKLLSAPRKDLV